MASLQSVFQGGFDATSVQPDEGRDFAPLPAGAYDVELTGAEVKNTKAGNGCYLSCEFTIVGEQGNGRKVWSNITLRNPNQQAESIGRAQLSSLCRAVGIAQLEDTDQLFQKLLRVRLKVVPATAQYQAKNEVSAYEAMGGAAQSGPGASRPAANAPAPTAPAKMPWQK